MLTRDAVANAYELTEPGPFLDLCVQAVNSYVSTLPDIKTVEVTETLEDGTTVTVTKWDDDTVLGATMLAARLYERRDSRGGVINIGESASYVSRYDSDISRLLRMDSFRKAKVS